MTEWKFDHHEVLVDTDELWWHVVDRLESVDGNKQQYELADATHTEYKTLSAEFVEGNDHSEPFYESLGWTTTTKPAAENGYRVNGVLCGPRKVERWLGSECLHETSCPACDADGKGDIDVIHDIEAGEVRQTEYICLVCSENWCAIHD